MRRDLPHRSVESFVLLAMAGWLGTELREQYGLRFVANGLVIAGLLYVVRMHNRMLYGSLEVGFGAYSMYVSQTLKVGYSEEFGSDFQHGALNLNTVAAVGALYVVIRGYDNLRCGFEYERQR